MSASVHSCESGRYRKEAHGGLDDAELHRILRRLALAPAPAASRHPLPADSPASHASCTGRFERLSELHAKKESARTPRRVPRSVGARFAAGKRAAVACAGPSTLGRAGPPVPRARGTRTHRLVLCGTRCALSALSLCYALQRAKGAPSKQDSDPGQCRVPWFQTTEKQKSMWYSVGVQRRLCRGTTRLPSRLQLAQCTTIAELDELYRPYRPKRRTRASDALDSGRARPASWRAPLHFA
jgi:hypothetical protein